MLELEN